MAGGSNGDRPAFASPLRAPPESFIITLTLHAPKAHSAMRERGGPEWRTLKRWLMPATRSGVAAKGQGVMLDSRRALTRLVPRARWFTFPLLALGVMVVAAVTLLPAMNALLAARRPGASVWFVGLFGTGSTLLLIVMVSALFAGLNTARTMQTDTYQLVRLTHVPRIALVRFHLALVLQRLRLLLAFGAALVPAFFVAVIHWSMRNVISMYPTSPILSRWLRLPAPPRGLVSWRFQTIGFTPEFGGWVLGLWGVTLLAIVLSIGVTLRTRRAVTAGVAGGILALLVAGALVLPIILLPLERWDGTLRVLLTIGLALAPYFAALGVMRLIRRWV